MKSNFLGIFVLANILMLFSCAEKQKKIEEEVTPKVEKVIPKVVYDTNNPKTILNAVAQKHGGWNDLWKKRDVKFTSKYHDIDTDRTDLSEERYIFKNEVSFGRYSQHDYNVLPDVEGTVTQFFNGKKTIVLVDDTANNEPEAIAFADFLRKANYFWFLMHYKLNDNGILVNYKGTENEDDTVYDVLEITYESQNTGKELNDIYIVYVNPQTRLIDKFYFSVPFMGVTEPLIIAKYQYIEIDGQLIATKRDYFMPSENGYSESPNLVQTITNVRFNNGFTLDNITK